MTDLPDEAEKHSASDTYTTKGDVYTGAFGTGASANVGAIGRESRGYVFAGGSDDDQRRLKQALEVIDELRRTIEAHRDAVGDLHETITDQVDEIQADIEERKPSSWVQRKLNALAGIVKPFGAIAAVVAKLAGLAQGGNA